METQSEESGPGLLLNEVFANHTIRSSAFGFVEESFNAHPTMKKLVDVFGDPDQTRTWLLATFYNAWLRTYSGDLVLRDFFGGPVPDQTEMIVITTDAAGFLLTHPDFPEVSPQIREIRDFVDPDQTAEVIRTLAENLARTVGSDMLFELLTDQVFLKNLMVDLLQIAPALVGVSKSPESQEVSAPYPPLPVEMQGSVSTAGVLAKYRDGETVITTAFHGTGPKGTPIKVDGQITEVIAHHEELDVAIAKYSLGSEGTGRSFPVLTIPPGPTAGMYFCGVASKDVKKTYVDGVDPAISAPEPGEKVRVYTRNDAQHGDIIRGDSGCALITEDGHVAGFAWARTRRGAGLRFSKWIWAKSVFDFFQLEHF